jgi:serine protease AprX
MEQFMLVIQTKKYAMKKYLLLICCSVFFVNANAQLSRYIVRLKDKATNPFSINNPAQYLGPRSLQRRLKYNIAIDSTDLPVTPRYIDSLRLAGAVTILNSSKWLNQVAIKTNDAAAIAKINSYSFVISTTAVASKNPQEISPVNKQLDADNATGISGGGSSSFIEQTTADVYNYGLSHGQVHLHRGEFLHNHGFKGEGMIMTILDAGFYHYQTLRTFDSIRNNNQILGTYDFVANETSVNEDDTHGMQCLSTIGANIPGVFVGTAPKTSFYLYRTEDVASEYQIEEQNFAAGLERADSIGVDITSTSLGYNQFDNPANSYTYADMNGNTTISARAADYAAKKGIMMVIAAGNEGSKPWHYIITPSDADSVMAVGAVDTLRNVAAFSSYGPSSDGQVKPSLAATGLRAVIANTVDGNPTFGNGTSFATPNLAGLTTCLMQAFPEYNNMVILDAMQRSASKFLNPDVRIGYGIPDMIKAFTILQKKTFSQQNTIANCLNAVNFKIKFDNSMTVFVEKKTADQAAFSPFKTFAGSGNFSVKDLSFTDDLTLAAGGQTLYRLKVDIAGDTSFIVDSFGISVPQLCANPVNTIKINPNPVIDNLNVIISRIESTKITIVITNAAGQRVYENAFAQPAGSQVQSINMNGKQAGIYYVTVFAEGKKIVTERILKR